MKFSKFLQNAKDRFNEAVKNFNDEMQTDTAKSTGNYVFNITAAALGFYFMFSGLAAIIAPLLGLTLVGLALFNVADPGCVTKPIMSFVQLVVDGFVAAGNSVVNFFKRICTPKQKPVDNKGELEEEPEEATNTPESKESYFSGTYNCIANMFDKARKTTGEMLYKGDYSPNQTGGPVFAPPRDESYQKLKA